MNTISPALNHAYQLLRTEIYLHLDEAEHLAQFDSWDDKELDLVRQVIPNLATVIRGMIALHESTNTGQCKACDVPWPCQITETVHNLIKNPDDAFVQIVRHLNATD